MPRQPLTAIILIGLICVLGLAGCGPSMQSADVISLDFPHGELRLRVARDGGATLGYGALAEQLQVAAGTFDFELLLGDLQPRLNPVVASEAIPPGPHGMVSLIFPDDSDSNYLLYDENFANDVLRKACANRAGPLLPGMSADMVERACVDLLSRIP